MGSERVGGGSGCRAEGGGGRGEVESGGWEDVGAVEWRGGGGCGGTGVGGEWGVGVGGWGGEGGDVEGCDGCAWWGGPPQRGLIGVAPLWSARPQQLNIGLRPGGVHEGSTCYTPVINSLKMSVCMYIPVYV